jgi:superfamily I DNA/RNA helicase
VHTPAPAASGRKKESEPLPVSDTLTTAQTPRAVTERILAAKNAAIVTGPPGSGKTKALAEFAAVCMDLGERSLVVVSHESGARAFEEAMGNRKKATELRISTLPELIASWMNADYLNAGAAPLTWVGSESVTRAIVARAATGLLDMTWPMFARCDINLDLPYLSKPETFLDEAASLFRLLQRSRISAQEFEEGCTRGLGAFYGEQTERAAVLLADRSVTQSTSRRGRDAMRASPGALAVQRKAERDIAIILAALYREYLREAARSPVRAPEDILDAGICWLSSDESAAARIAASIDEFIVDDAEDADPALAAVIALLHKRKPFRIVLAGWEGARVDGFEGRRSALASFDDAERIELAPQIVVPATQVHRFEDESTEISWLARDIMDVISQGSRPGGIAIVTRNVDAAGLYARALESAGVPILMPASKLQRPVEIGDLLALGAVIDDPFDLGHLLRVLSSPVVALSDASLRALCRAALERQQLQFELDAQAQTQSGGSRPPEGTLARNVLDGSVDDTLPAGAQESVRSLRQDLQRWRVACNGMSLAQRLLFLADAGGFRTHWQHTPDYERARLSDDLLRVSAAAAQLEATLQGATAADFEDLLERDAIKLQIANRSEHAVVAETIVGVKGLRFDYVFVAGVAHERFPRIYTSHSMAFSRTYGLIIRENVARGASQTAKFAWYYARFAAKSMYLDEERRALNYALQRARVKATASGFGVPPSWARDHDLLATLNKPEQPRIETT